MTRALLRWAAALRRPASPSARPALLPASRSSSIPRAGTSSPRSATRSPSDERKAFLALARGGPGADFIADFWRPAGPDAREPKRTSSRSSTTSASSAPTASSPAAAPPAGSRTAAGSRSPSARPTTASTYPRGVTFYGVPTEIWYYGFFPILFVDERWVDDYRLDPSESATPDLA
ncbi:MAG: hypothetical protein MZU79_04100 [Anaerotruncus sp.]|nr:hypothetical protein [Anaerotruncus sp.]